MVTATTGSAAPAPAPPTLGFPAAATGRSGYGDGFRHGGATGSSQIELPLPISPGRGAPALSLHYTQGIANGPFGLGMALDLPSIGRWTGGGVPRYDDTDIFLGPDGERLVPASADSPGGVPARRSEDRDGVRYAVTRYLSRTDPQHERVERWTAPDGDSFWIVRSADNAIAVFGRDPAARTADPAAPRRVFEWLLQETTDRHGNRTVYSWTPDAAETAQGYLTAVDYANYAGADGREAFALRLTFHYAPIDADRPPATVSGPETWPVRQDPFSSFHAGFEIRTLRLCHAVVMVHAFADLPGDAPLAVRGVLLGYDEDPVHSRLASFQVVGWRHGDTAEPARAALPPLAMTFSRFVPAAVRWLEVTGGRGAGLAGALGGRLAAIDLNGEGVPGLLREVADSAWYHPPLGEGRFGDPQPLPRFPNAVEGSRLRGWLADLEGNGRLSLVVPGSDGAPRGFFGRDDAGAWTAFQPFRSVPAETGAALAAGAAFWVDLTGDGRTDFLVVTPQELRGYLSFGAAGFSGPVVAPRPAGFPVGPQADPAALVTFADMFGDGMVHCVRVADGTVTVWPNLGYGRFGAPRSLPGAPRLGPNLAPERLLLGGITGSGAADLIVLHDGRATLYPNHNGNGFGPAIEVAIPGGLDPLDHAFLGDLLGHGSTGLVVGHAGASGGRQLYLDPAPDDLPNLLIELDNGRGACSRLYHRSSVAYYLADQRAGRPWATRLATPVTVVEALLHIDQINGRTAIESHQYRDGYFDPIDRVFRGFAESLTQNSMTRDAVTWHFPTADRLAPDVTAAEAAGPSGRGGSISDSESAFDPPSAYRLSRSWYFTGALGTAAAALEASLAATRFNGDPDALVLGPAVIDPAAATGSAETVRQAHAAVHGRLRRSETYSVDESGHPAAVPLLVEQHTYSVELIQAAPALRLDRPPGSGAGASVRVVPRENAHSAYEGTAADPRTEHELILAHDAYGFPTRVARAGYPRRSAQADAGGDKSGNSGGGAATIRAAQTQLLLAVSEGRFAALDTPDTYLTGIPVEERSWQVNGVAPGPSGTFDRDGLAVAIVDVLQTGVIPFGEPFDPGSSPQARVERWQQLRYWNAGQTDAAPLGTLSPQALLHHERNAAFPDSLVQRVYGGRVTADRLETDGGYTLEAGLWWAPGIMFTYAGAAGYFEMTAAATVFLERQKRASTYAYDAPYWLHAVTGTDPTGHSVSQSIDYQVLEPASVTDVNGIIEQRLYEPLGRPRVQSRHAGAGADWQGFMDLARWQDPGPADTAAVLAEPERFIQGAERFLFYADDTWRPGAAGAGAGGSPPQPAHAITVQRRLYTDRPDWTAGTGGPSALAVEISYADGADRPLESMHRVEAASVAQPPPGAAADWLWLRAERLAYGRPMSDATRRFLPAFAAMPDWQPDTDEPFDRLRYDALDRLVQVETAKGFIEKTGHATAWEESYWDADDTILTSPYYAQHHDDPDLPAGARAALAQAVALADTPVRGLFDPFGQPLGHVDPLTDGAGGAPTDGWTVRLPDIHGLPWRAADPRLSRTAGQWSQTVQHDMLGRTMGVDAVDSGSSISLLDVLGQPIGDWDATGTEARTQQDALLRRPLQVTLIPGDGRPAYVGVRYRYGTDAATLSVHAVVEIDDQAGRQSFSRYGLDGQPVRAGRRFAQMVSDPIDWSQPDRVALQAETHWTAFERDADGASLRETRPDGTVVTWERLSLGWLHRLTVTPPDGAAAVTLVDGQTYDAKGQPVTADVGSGLRLVNGYDPFTWSLSQRKLTPKSGAAALLDADYWHDPIGNLVQVDDRSVARLIGGAGVVQPLKRAFKYDSWYRLIGADGWLSVQPGAVPVTLGSYGQTLHYDLADNLTDWQRTGDQPANLTMVVAATSNRAVPNSLLGPGETPDALFDPAGRQIKSSQGFSLTYTAEGVLGAATGPAPQATAGPTAGGAAGGRYAHDAEGLRARQVTVPAGGGPGTDQRFVGDWLAFAPAVDLQGGGDAAIATIVNRVGDDEQVDLLTLRTVASGALEHRLLLTDLTGAAIITFDVEGRLIAYEDYFPYGAVATRATADGTEDSFPLHVGYAAKQEDLLLDLYDFGARLYDPAVGRFLTPDPHGDTDSQNLYLFAGANPTSWSDPDGFGRTPSRRVKKVSGSKKIRKHNTQNNRYAGKNNSYQIKVTQYGGIGAKKGTVNFGGQIYHVSDSKKKRIARKLAYYEPKPSDWGRKLKRSYPMTSEAYASPITKKRYVRGHLIPHMNTVMNSPASGGLASTYDAEAYHPEPKEWGIHLRNRREQRATKRGVPIATVLDYSSIPDWTKNKTPVPSNIYFVEFTGQASDKTYSGSKKYNAKIYGIDTAKFNYTALPLRANGSGRSLNPHRLKTVPSIVSEETARIYPGFKFKL